MVLVLVKDINPVSSLFYKMFFLSQCGVISKHQYVKWRETGVAFEMREGLYQTANQSLLSTRVFNHVSRLTVYYNSCGP